ncbi:rod-binding protein [Stieleria varia]|uniref:Peptidoglycan hydrolase FlgJ n=1 Tax=Stieleria varia TaxID=2528005 RepID=A0A5C6AS70_9BACT|nr:rod-binding protein [Stieleria varia]TWU02378.1 Peptidoglycan hydrolase FlgJ [Stieleria varia]
MNPISGGLTSGLLDSATVTNLPSDAIASRMESVGTEFEGVFLSMMVKEMRNSLETGFFGEESSDTYGGMFDLFIGKHLAQSRPLGIAEMMLEQYSKNQDRSSPTASESSPQSPLNAETVSKTI